MQRGWIKLYRKLMDNPIFVKAELLQLFIFCLLKANHKGNCFIHGEYMIEVQPGQFVTGRKQLAKALKQKETTVWKRLIILKKLGFIYIKSTNRFSIVTIIEYGAYQNSKIEKEHQGNIKTSIKKHQSDTNNNNKELNNNLINKSRFFSTNKEKLKYGQSNQVHTPANDI